MNARHAIHELRGKGWNDVTIARAIGCSQPTITRIRHGKSDPRESTAIDLQKLLADQLIQEQAKSNHPPNPGAPSPGEPPP